MLKYPLTWNDGSLYKEANFHPCWSMLRVNCPILVTLPSPTLPLSPSPPHMQTLTTADDMDMPKSFLSGTRMTLRLMQVSAKSTLLDSPFKFGIKYDFQRSLRLQSY
jgi:hypothetical protein